MFDNTNKPWFLTLAIILTALFGLSIFARCTVITSFDKNCTEYLEKATEVNSVDLAKENLKEALSHVSILEKEEANNNEISYWYKNLKSSYEELESLPNDLSSLEEHLVLARLGSEIDTNVPEEVKLYPYGNFSYLLCAITFGIGAIIFWICFFVSTFYWDE